ncbi:MAG: hypothetical protein CBC13_04605 [Planctomycetia bacterium TMED53]|nr:MAG: hypothetical protein CBC13_04605 [Planctomycetia bacterium TMED53]
MLFSLRSWGSLLRGHQPIESLLEQARKQGWQNLALTEIAELGTCVEATRHAARISTPEIEPMTIIIGAELPCRKPRGEAAGGRDHHLLTDTHSLPKTSMLILPIDATGLVEVHQTVSDWRFGTAVPASEEREALDRGHRLPVPENHLELLCQLSHCWLITGDPDLAVELLKIHPQISSRLILEVDRWGSSISRERQILDCARQHRLRLVAGGRFGGLNSLSAHQTHLLDALGCQSTVEQMATQRREQQTIPFSPGQLLPIPTVNEWRRRYHDLPEAIAGAEFLTRNTYPYPEKPAPTIFPPNDESPGQSAYGQLYQRCHQGLLRRHGEVQRPMLERLTRELQVIDEMGFVPYFLVVGEIIDEARRLGIASAGRGSGAASIVAYALGITQVDPIRHRLRFERFLHPHRSDLPDIDIDLCWQGREALIDHVYQRYGNSRTAMICTRQVLQVRSALREAARAHGVAPLEIDRLSRRLPHRLDGSIAAYLRNDPVLASLPLSAKAKQTLLEDAQWLCRRPHHRSIHPGGICIADRPIAGIVGIERANRGIPITQLDMYSIEHTGLIKIDLLGNRCISELGTARDLIEENSGEVIDLDGIPEECSQTAELVREGRTLGCFQLESPAMRALLIQMQAQNAADVIQSVALIRPGPSAGGLKESYCRRIRGEEEGTPPHPALTDLLSDQQGLMLYEENVMETIATMMQIPLAQADVIRRQLAKAVRKEDEETLEKLGEDFVTGALKNGYGIGESQKLWQHLFSFARYSFNKSHAASYGLLAWRSAWFKAHHPAEFMCALFRHHAGMYPFSAFVAEARRIGVTLRLPCIHHSQKDFSMETDGAIRLPLSIIHGSRRESIQRIFAKRPFSSPEDLIRRTGMPLSELEDWILLGALDDFDIPRPQLIWRTVARHSKERKEAHENTSSDLPGISDAGPELADFTPARKLHEELRLLGAAISAHPLALFRSQIQQQRCVPMADLHRWRGRTVRVAGIRLASRQHPTKTGPMGFLTLEDEEAICEVTCFSRLWPQVRKVLLERPQVIVVIGKVDVRMDVISVIADQVIPLQNERATG